MYRKPIAKLEAYLGFVHSVDFSKPSLVLDFMEPYRFLVDDFLVQFAPTLAKKTSHEKRVVLGWERMQALLPQEREKQCLHKSLEEYFQNYVSVPRVTVGKGGGSTT